MTDISRSESSFCTAQETRPLEQDCLDNRDMIAEIIADLTEDCEEAFSRPTSKCRRSTETPSRSRSSYRTATEMNSPSTTKQEVVTQELLHLPNSQSMNPQTTLATDAIESTGQGRAQGTCPEEDLSVPEMMDSYRTSKRSSFSHPSSMQHDGTIDSATSLVKAKDKHVGTKSNLREEMPEEKETPSMVERQEASETAIYPSTAKTAVIMSSLYISIFLVALDRTIIGPAIPAITNEFNSIGDIGWYGSSYMLTSAGFILLYGRIYLPRPSFFLASFSSKSAVRCVALRSQARC
jgi:hypothetical protein